MSPGERGSTKPIAGTAFYVLLALADRGRYGLDIAREVDRRTGGEVRLGPGTLYNAVKKMLREGLIVETTPTDDGTHNDPRRRYYAITAPGRATLEAEAGRLERLVGAARAKKVLPSG